MVEAKTLRRSQYVLGTTGLEKIEQYVQPAESGILWLNFAGNVEQTRDWLSREKLLDETHIDALCSELTRPRLYVDGDRNVMLTLRTSKETATASLDFMSLRVWASNKLIITVARWPTDIIDVFAEFLKQRTPPVTSIEQVLLLLSQYVTDEFTDTINELDDQIITLEDAWDESQDLSYPQLTEARQRLSRIGRYLPPQLEALQKLAQHMEDSELPKATKRHHQDAWREVTNGVRRDIEALSEMRERLTILKDSVQQQSSEGIQRTMYLLSLLSTFFLPLTFMTGLLGMNVAGIPAADYQFAFWIVCGLMGLVAIGQWIMFRRWQWLN